MELKDIFEYMGFEKEPTNIDEFKETVKSNWTLKKQAVEDESIRKAVLGSSFKSVGQNIRKKINESYGLEIPNSELENTQLEDFVFNNIEKIKTSYEAKIQDYEKKITEPNEVLKEYETKLSTFEKRLNEEKNAKKAIEQEYNQFKEVKTNELKNYKIDVLKKDIFSKIKFSNEVSDVAKIGYNALIESKYNIDFDENNEPIVVSKNNGERIPNEKVAGKYKTPFEIFEEEAINNKLVQLNEQAPNKPMQKSSTFVNSGTENTQSTTKKVFFGTPK